jgi:hypothetical protein
MLTFGRLYNYAELGEFLSILTVGKDQPDIIFDQNMDLVPKCKAMYEWTAEAWKAMREDLVELRKHMLRTDANACIETVVDEKKNRNPDERLQGNIYFDRKFLGLLKLFSFHEKLAPFRKTLETAYGDKNIDEHKEYLPVSKEFMKRFK